MKDPEEDFEGFIIENIELSVKEFEDHPEAEYWVAKSAARLYRLIKIEAPHFLIEKERRLLVDRVYDLPVYCNDYDKLNQPDN